MHYYINITADTNDADYISELNEISEEQLEKILPVIEAIKGFQPYDGKLRHNGSSWRCFHNFPNGECLREDLGEKSPEELYVETGLVTQEQLEAFYEFIPSDEYGIHTIKHVKLLKVVEEQELL